MCVCEGFTVPFADSMCENVPNRLGTETVPCNYYACGLKPACNKRCWMSIFEPNVRNNITDGIFQCSMGCTTDVTTCPKGKSYSQVLTEPVPPLAENAEWYYLAKEWYAAMLNQAYGAPLPPLAIQAMNQATQLLQNCAGWGPDEMKLLAIVYALKEKLNRANNEIGGLDQVDDQVANMVGGMSGESNDEEGTNKSLIGVIIGVPMAAVAIIAVAIMFAVYYVRRKSYVVVAPTETIPPESSLVDNGNEEVPLEHDQQKGEDSSSEEKI